jgi:hypothetical protein
MSAMVNLRVLSSVITRASIDSWLMEINDVRLALALSKHKARPRLQEKLVCSKACELLMCSLAATNLRKKNLSRSENLYDQ